MFFIFLKSPFSLSLQWLLIHPSRPSFHFTSPYLLWRDVIRPSSLSKVKCQTSSKLILSGMWDIRVDFNPEMSVQHFLITKHFTVQYSSSVILGESIGPQALRGIPEASWNWPQMHTVWHWDRPSDSFCPSVLEPCHMESEQCSSSNEDN